MLTSSKSIKSLSVLILGVAIAPLALAGGTGGYPSYTPDLLPANPNTGECYARVEVPAQFATGSQRVMVEEGYSHLQVQQPQLASRQEKVMVKEASTRFRVRQPSYRSITEQMLVRPAYDKLSVSAPQFSTVKERVKTSAPRLVWKRGNPGKLAAQGYTIHSTADAGRYGQGYSSTIQQGIIGGTSCGDTCEIWCLVEEPGASVEFNRKVMTSPGRVQRTTVPAKYQTIHKQVVSDPGGVEEIPVAAEYRTVSVQDIVHPGGENAVHVPPKYADVATKTVTSPERYEWRRVLCAPGTGTIKSSADYARSTSTHSARSYSTAPTYSTRTYSSPTSAHTPSTSYTQPSYSAPTSQPTGRIVTGTGYYGGYNSSDRFTDDSTSSYSSGTPSYGSGYTPSKRKRIRRR